MLNQRNIYVYHARKYNERFSAGYTEKYIYIIKYVENRDTITNKIIPLITK